MRVPAKPLRNYPFYLQPFFWNQRRKYGEVLQAALLWARAPKLFTAVAMLYGMIDRRSSPIDAAIRSLVTVRVSQINTCSFCVDLNSATLLKRGVSLEKVEALETWRQSNLFDARLKVSDEQVDRLRPYFDDDGIVELTGLVAFPEYVEQVQQRAWRTSSGIL